MSSLDLLLEYGRRVLPGCAAAMAMLLVLPRDAIAWRVATYVWGFVLLRDAMTPLHLWAIHAKTASLTLPSDPAALLALGASTVALVVLIQRAEPSLRALVVWVRGPWPLGAAAGCLGAIAVAALPGTYHLTLAGSSRPPLVSGALVSPLLVFSLCGNLLEEVLFRGYFQGELERRVSPLRAAFASAILFALCHAFLATTVTNEGALVLVFTFYEGLIAALLRMKLGVVAAAIAHGGGIFLIAAGIA